MSLRYWVRHPVLFCRRIWYYIHEKTHLEEPFLAPATVRFLDEALPREGAGLEWGSGRSTRWLARRLHKLISVEHDEAWAKVIRQQLAGDGLTNVDYRLVPLDHDAREPTRPVYDPVPRYVSVVNQFPDEHFDFIEVDGHYRQACVLACARKLKRQGLLLIDDSNWLPMDQWGVPETFQMAHQSMKINTTTSVWRRLA